MNLTEAEILRKSADTIRFLAAEAVQKANSGHPGMPMGMADASVVLWTKFLNHNPQNPQWFNRDRFVLSAGHGSMLLYSLLHLTGYELTMEDLQNFRQWGSKTPGHPEYGHTVGVEITTGPLGQGISSAVGMALAERHLAAKFNEPAFEIVNHYTYVICGDGDLQEGISHEASALAGHWGLGKLVVLYDSNGITIDGPTSLSFTEDVAKRYEAYGWQVLFADGHDVASVEKALHEARADENRPTIIVCTTHIGYGSPKQDTYQAHGSPLGDDNIQITKDKLGWLHPEKFYVPQEVENFMRGAIKDGEQAEASWNLLFHDYENAHPQKAANFKAAIEGQLPNLEDVRPVFDKAIATRASSGMMLESLKKVVPQLLGGSADLTPSNNTKSGFDTPISKENYAGSYFHFGIREHGMGAIMNGLALHGGVLPYGGTFLVFSDYVRPSVRLSALMDLPVTYIFTHDSIGVGEDGPTHQPIEHLSALSAIPNLHVWRPADAYESVGMWKAVLKNKKAAALALSRQNLPLLPEFAANEAEKGGYVLRRSENANVVLAASGSEVQLAIAAADKLAEAGIEAQVVSMPCMEVFAQQSEDYQEEVLPLVIPVVAVEAGLGQRWDKFVGRTGRFVGMTGYGASAPAEVLYQEFGITVEAVVAAAQEVAY